MASATSPVSPKSSTTSSLWGSSTFGSVRAQPTSPQIGPEKADEQRELTQASSLPPLVPYLLTHPQLCPIYESPQVDLGYDISNYRAIHAPYGTLADFEHLLSETHKRGMKLIMDLVVNHCSDQHEWFKEARRSKDDPKRDWFYWKKGVVDEKTGKMREPNNWRSVFGGSAWTYDEGTEEYFLRLFCPEQPDLNWGESIVVGN